jgi:hypothetical protein
MVWFVHHRYERRHGGYLHYFERALHCFSVTGGFLVVR